MDFDTWMQGQGKPKVKTWDDWYEEGEVSKRENDSGFIYLIPCCCCGYDFEISDLIGPEEFDPDNRNDFYCGRSPRCCP